jgi:hypothetical protein
VNLPGKGRQLAGLVDGLFASSLKTQLNHEEHEEHEDHEEKQKT